MKNKRVSLAVVGLAAVVASMTGAGVSQAVEASGVHARQSFAAAASHVAQAPADLPVHRGKYWTRGGCMEAGQEGVDRGHWSQFQCANGPVFWNLWTDR
ncbi:hypothetical protein [Streptomyces sp. ISL-11]|uniref:hypothetical protein n=1 Tax=Streptomyces sp. ISL-11 TaxID=2819174 RepID=UPI001BEAB566|nr:hypothetical protein [Streptomyces sp. ISL-11]MBT2385944.1 hypothetical protein [Streptomyces sp. ISL-11]